MKKKTCFLIYVETRKRIWHSFFQNKKPDVTDNCEIINKFTSDSESSYTYSSIPLIFLDFAFRIACNNSEKKKKRLICKKRVVAFMLHTRDDRRSKFVNIIYCISRFQHGKVQILQYRAHELSSGGRGRKKGRQEGHGIFGGMVAQEGEATHVKGTCFCFFFAFLRVTGMLRSKKPRAKRAYTCICICI